jgi:hypothetical protein
VRRFSTFVLLAACAGDDGTTDADAPQDPAEYGCFHIAEGEILDASLARDETAREVIVGLDPYRVNLQPDPDAGYLRLELAQPTDLLLLMSKADTVHAVWSGETRTEVGPGEPDPFCEQDIEEMLEVSLDAGTHHIELGPSLWASVWLLVAEQL